MGSFWGCFDLSTLLQLFGLWPHGHSKSPPEPPSSPSHLEPGFSGEVSLPPTSLQSHLLLGLPCLLPSTETRAPWPWQMCEAGEGTRSPDVIVFMFPESEGSELWTGAAGGGVVWLQPLALAFPPPPPSSSLCIWPCCSENPTVQVL